eukprot:g28729.t1
MDYASESFLNSRISIKDRQLSTSLYRNPTETLMMLHFSSFHSNHIKEAIPYGQALCIDSICSDEKEHDGHLKALKDALIRTGYNAQLNHQFRHVTVKNRNDLLRRQTQDMTDRELFIFQYLPGAEKLYHVLHSLQCITNDNEHLTKIFPMSPLHAIKQLLNLKQTIVCSKLPSLQDNIDHNTIQPCHSNLCKTCQIFDMDTTIKRGNTTHH